MLFIHESAFPIVNLFQHKRVGVSLCVQPLLAHRQKDNNSHVRLNSCTNMTAFCDTWGLPH